MTDKSKKTSTTFTPAIKQNNGVKPPTTVPRPGKPPVQKQSK